MRGKSGGGHRFVPNAWNGLITANAAFVPAGTSSAISIYVSDAADVFFDIDSYFAP
jgi:hypothetical protein